MTRRNTTGWYAEIDVDESTLTPTILSGAQRELAVNSFPSVSLPVPGDDRWLRPELDDAPCRVFDSGDRQPIDRVEHRRRRPESVELEGRGGLELLRRVQREVEEQAADDFLREILNDRTDYEINVDDPETDEQTNSQLQVAADESEFSASLSTDSLSPTTPISLTNGGVETHDTAYTREGLSIQLSQQQDSREHLSVSDGAYLWQFSDDFSTFEYDIDIDYTIPEESVATMWLTLYRYLDWSSSSGPFWVSGGVDISVNGTVIGAYADEFSRSYQPQGGSLTIVETVETADGASEVETANTDGETFEPFGDSVEVDDTLLISADADFDEIVVELDTGSGGLDVIWEYDAREIDEDGSTVVREWRELPNATDSTNGLSSSGSVTWSAQQIYDDVQESDGESVIHSGSDVRARVTSVEDGPTQPQIDRLRVRSGPTRTFVDQNYSGGDVESGTATIKFESRGAEGPGFAVDIVTLFDTRFEHQTSDFSVDEERGYYSGPEKKPDSVTFEFGEVVSPLAIERAEATLETTGGPARLLGISEDSGDTYEDVTDTNSVEVEYADLTTSVKVRVEIGRTDATQEGATPLTGIESQRVDSYELVADLDDTPLLTSRVYDDQLHNVLTEVCEFANFVWEYSVDEDGNGRVDVTQVGRRDVDTDVDLLGYEVDRQTEDQIDRAIVKGSTQRAIRDPITANHNAWVGLSQADLLDGKEVVYDPDTDESFERGEDYRIRYSPGEIQTLEDGDISDGQELRVDYEFLPVGEFTSPAFEGDEKNARTIVESVPNLTTDLACEQTATYAVQAGEGVIWEWSIEIPRDADIDRAISAINPERLPFDGAQQVRAVETTDESIQLRGASRRSASEAIDDIRTTLSRTSDRV